MFSIEKIIETAEKLPGFYGYRPVFIGTDLSISEMVFRLEDNEKEVDYTVILFYEEGEFTDSLIDVRYNDGSIAAIEEDDEDFKDIIGHKNKIMWALNRVR
jgi:hypothetical protein